MGAFEYLVLGIVVFIWAAYCTHYCESKTLQFKKELKPKSEDKFVCSVSIKYP